MKINKADMVRKDLAVINRILSYWQTHEITDSFDFDTWITYCNICAEVHKLQTELIRGGVFYE